MPDLADKDEIDAARLILDRFRASFKEAPFPLTKVNMGLRSMASRVSPDARVTQRLKRQSRIIEKLARFPTMQLTTMEDIGGCRVVVPTYEEALRLRERVESRWGQTVTRNRDYVAHPKETGYRAFHLVVIREGFPIEIQIRTSLQQTWAEAVEAAELASGTMLKDGRGAADVLAFFRALGTAFAALDRGEPIPRTVRRAVVSGAAATRRITG